MATMNTTGAASVSSQSSGTQTYRGPFAIMTILFFMWGFMTVWNDVLIPRFKEAFTLNYLEAMLVQFAFFGAYGIGSLIYYIISMTTGDPINRIGYKNGVIIGLLIAAAVARSYPFFLLALFIVGLGFAMLRIAANPYVTILGPEVTASSRLNLSQAFNSFGATIGPVIGGWLIFTFFTSKDAHGADSVKIPYLCFAGVFVLLAVFFKFAHLPSFANTGTIERGLGAMKHPHTALGILAIEGLGPQKSQASSLLVMAILGGALLAPLQGWIADNVGIQPSFIVPVLAFAYIAFYGVYGYKAGRSVSAASQS